MRDDAPPRRHRFGVAVGINRGGMTRLSRQVGCCALLWRQLSIAVAGIKPPAGSKVRLVLTLATRILGLAVVQ